jgi:phage-related protein
MDLPRYRLYAIIFYVTKTFIAVKSVRAFVEAQPDDFQAEYWTLVERLEADGRLVEPFAKKLDESLFEIRLRRGRQVRVIYFYHVDDLIVGVHAFVKKTQITPLIELRQARAVMRRFQQGVYDEA